MNKYINDKKISRKDFLKKSSAGLITLGLAGTTPFKLLHSETEKKQGSPQYRILGRTGFKVSALGFGASRTMEPSLVKAALDKGLNFIDTGRLYFNGQNEVMIGKVVKGIRENVLIQSKVKIKLKKNKKKIRSGKEDYADLSRRKPDSASNRLYRYSPVMGYKFLGCYSK